jgi:excisionase family DNA binding protein
MLNTNISTPIIHHQPDEHQYLTVKEVAQRLNVSSSTVNNLARDGEMPVIYFGRLLRVPVNKFEQYLESKLGEYYEVGVKFFSVEDVAAKIFFGRSTTYGLVGAEKIPSVKFRTLIRIATTQLNAYLNQQACAAQV